MKALAFSYPNNWRCLIHKIYRILLDEEARIDGDLRVIDESGEDYLDPADYFALIELPTLESFSGCRGC